MTISYAKLFEVRILHNYYADFKSPDFEIIPTAKSAQALKNLRLKMRKLEDGVAIYAPISNAALLLQFPFELTDGIQLAFQIRLKNAHFLNFTELPLEIENNIVYYLTNKNTNDKVVTEFGASSRKLLCTPTNSFIADADQIILRPSIFKHIFATPVANFQFQVDGTPVVDPYTTTITTIENNEEYDLDLSSIPDGRHTLTTDTGADEIYISNELARSSPFGILEIFHNTDIDATYRFLNGAKEITAKTYYITFNNRETFWRYIFEDGLTDLTYLATDYDDNAAERWIQTKNKMNLTETYQTLQIKKDGKDIDLPNPSIHIVVPDESTSDVYSEIYL